MENSNVQSNQRYPYNIIVDHHGYSVDSKKENRFFVVHVTPHTMGDA